MKILVSGGTGLVGQELVRILANRGHQVLVLTRNISYKSLQNHFHWDPTKEEIDNSAFEDIDGLIHLAGAGIAQQRWTKKRKEILYNSRIASAKFLHRKCLELNVSPKFFISCSATGWYGGINDLAPKTEVMDAYPDFLGNMCVDWEEAADLFKNDTCQVSKLRLGLVLSQEGGALPIISLPIKFGIGSRLGSGNQFMPWIHIDDLCEIFLQLVEGLLPHSIYNAVTPNYVTNKEFTRLIAKALHRPLWVPHVPSFVLRLLFGEMSNILLKGSPVSADKLSNHGFTFKFPELSIALSHIWRRVD
tara:strand:+ start:195 stop:1106 length:912 start_codon:yes stop_codon:yes gene_type:complete